MDGMFDDLLGDEPRADNSVSPLDSGPGFEKYLKPSHVHELQRGVTINWLAQAFGTNRKQVQKRVAECPVLRAGQNGTSVYDFRVVCAYMVDPKINVKKYIENMDPKELPQKLTREFWAAKLAEQRWRQQANELWASEDVIAVFGEVFKLIKSKTRLWQNSISAVEVMSPAQTEALTTLVEDLLDKIFQTLEALESGQSTASQIAEVADEDDAE